MRPLSPTPTAHLYPGLHAHLMELLRSLSPADWQRPTVCRGWSVQDIASHILDTQVRILSAGRDHHRPPAPESLPADYSGLVAFLNRLNADWVHATRRMSPPVLIEFLSITGPQLSAHVASLDPDATAPTPVAWAGEESSPNWFNIGRNYTEYWHHQQQIRDAVSAPPLTGREWLHPVLTLFVRALPVTYRSVDVQSGKSVSVRIHGEAGGSWTLMREDRDWKLFEGDTADPSAAVSLSDDTAWRIFTKGLDRQQASERVQIEGDTALASSFLNALAVMA